MQAVGAALKYFRTYVSEFPDLANNEYIMVGGFSGVWWAKNLRIYVLST